MSVAPVIDWKYYDTIYTERYMKTPQLNPKGYQKSAVNDVTGFKKLNYLLVQGTADDNVHFQNSAHLVWKLTGAGVHSYRVQFYTDSDHGINANRAHIAVFELLQEFVLDTFSIESK
jgi:dipeptidyl aminopeptidase